MHPFIPRVEVGMNRIIKVGKQVVLVAVVAGFSAYVAASFAVNGIEARNLKVKTGVFQLVENPKPCSQHC
jgi:hypothetical protein